MQRPLIPSAFIPIAVLLLLAGCSPENPGVQASTGSAEPLQVRRGDFVDRMVITGELEAAEGAVIAVPRLPSWQTSIKWIAPEGTELAEGEPVVELDNSEFATTLEQQRSTLMQAEHELAQKRAELAASLAQSEYEVERRKSDLDKAKLEASVPDELLARSEVEKRKLDLDRALTEFQKAVSTRDAARIQGDSELQNLRLSMEKAAREVSIAESAIQTLTLRAPRPGILVFNEHPWEGRKMQLGDSVFVSMTIAQIPNLETLQVVGTLADVDDGRVTPGMPVSMIIDAYPDRTFRGTVREVAPVAQELGRGSLRRGFRVVIPVVEKDLDRMRPGLSVRVIVERSEEKGVLLVPRSAVDIEAKKVLLDGGRLAEVELGACSAQDCIVKNGLEEGQRVRPLRRTAESVA